MNLAIPFLLGCACTAAACAPLKATIPVLPRNGDAAARQQAYAHASLSHEKGLFGNAWHRADGTYRWVNLESLAHQYPETNDIYSRAQTRGIVLGSIGGVGGGIVGGTLGWNLTAESSKRWSSSAQVAAYSIGGGIIVLGCIIGAIWHNPADDFADAYNANLRRELGLTPDAQMSSSSRFVPRMMGDGIGWTFH